MIKRIMVFDSTPNLLRLFSIILEKNGYEVMGYPHEFDCCTELKQFDPDLLIIGNMQGYHDKELKALKQLRSDPALSQLPVIVATTASYLIAHTLHEIRPICILRKPFEVNTLLECIKNIDASTAQVFDGTIPMCGKWSAGIKLTVN